MTLADLYTKVVLSIIAACLLILCIEQSHWSKLDAVQAQQPFVIEGFTYHGVGAPQTYRLGTNSGEQKGIPVVVVNK